MNIGGQRRGVRCPAGRRTSCNFFVGDRAGIQMLTRLGTQLEKVLGKQKRGGHEGRPLHRN
jgi:hypothetical protein